MKDKAKIEDRLHQAIYWRDKCALQSAPGYPFWDRDVQTLKWVLGISSEERFLRNYKAEGKEKS